MNLRPSGYEPDELPDCSIPRQKCMKNSPFSPPCPAISPINELYLRVLKQAHVMLLHVLTAEDESEYFESAAQLLKHSVQLIKHSSFPTTNRDGIPYGDQAIEYAVETLNESLTTNGHMNLDN